MSSSTSIRTKSSPGSRPKRARVQADGEIEAGPLSDILALGFVLVAIVHFLAIITYTPDDLPSWISFSSQAVPNEPSHNMMGPLGAILAGYSYFIFGAAAYFVPTGLLWFGAIKLVVRHHIPPREIIALGVFTVSGACLLHLQSFVFETWARDYNILGPGGCVGFGLGELVLMGVVGKGGAVLVAGFAYLSSMVMLTGLNPIQFARVTKRSFDHFRERIEQHRLERADMEERAEIEAKKRERERARAAREALKSGREARGGAGTRTAPGSRDPSPDPAFADELPLGMDTPEPKIIDGTARKSTADGNASKVSLAEIRAQRRAESKATFASAPRRLGLPSLAEQFADYELPDLDLLDFDDEADARAPADTAILLETQETIVRTLGTFGIAVTPGDITRGPTITRYEIYPGEGLRVSRIANLEPDIARATKAEFINIIAPIPGKDTVGIEIANRDKIAVPLRELLEDEIFTNTKAKLPLALGKDVYGNTIVADLASMPHLLVAGATGSGKSVCINSIIASLLFQFGPDQLRFIMIDPKVVEMQQYNSLPHLVIPVVTDPKKVLLALRWVVNEMERRYKVFAQVGVRNFEAFNKRQRENAAKAAAAADAQGPDDLGDIPPGESPDPALAAAQLHTCAVNIDADHGGFQDAEPAPRGTQDDDELEVPDSYPYIVVIIDELADLMQTAPADVEMAIARITQMARAAGIHLIVATQTPRADVITGVIKANIPSRIAFQVSSALDSRVILDSKGAEKLVGKGDMLYLPPGTSQLLRSQGAFLSDEEIFGIVQFCAKQARPVFEADAHAIVEGSGANGEDEEEVTDEDEEIIERCLDVIQQEKKASTSLLQRRLRLGYTRAARMIDILEARGIIGPGDGAKPREILVDVSDDDPLV
ncbi:hypothetical protein BH23VER1_BH23VER1_28310 [soil metagenome]